MPRRLEVSRAIFIARSDFSFVHISRKVSRTFLSRPACIFMLHVLGHFGLHYLKCNHYKFIRVCVDISKDTSIGTNNLSINKKGTCKFNINLFIIITGSIPLLANYRSVVSVYALTSFIRYTSYWNCLNNVIIIKTKALFPQAIGDVSRFWRSCWCLLVYFHPQLLTLSGFPIFRHWGYQMKVIPETWSAH